MADLKFEDQCYRIRGAVFAVYREMVCGFLEAARETSYWLRLLKDTHYLTEVEFQSNHADAEELCRIIGAIQKFTKTSADAKP